MSGPRPGRRSSATGRAWRRWPAELLAVLPALLTARLLVAASFVSAVVAADHLSPGGRPRELEQWLVGWDGQWYQAIAEQGYDGIPLEGVRFFPLLPWLGRLVDPVLPGGMAAALVVVSNVAAVLAAIAVRRLVLLETGDRRLAAFSVWITALFPSAFVLVWGYSESLMLAASIGAFLAMRTGRWAWAGALGAAAALARPLGLLLALPAAIEGLRGWQAANPRSRALRVLAVAGPLVGGGAYILWASVHFDDFLVPLTIQEDLRGEAAEPFGRVLSGLGDLFGAETFGDGLHVPFAIGFVVLLVVGACLWPVSYTAFAAVVLLAALAADNLNSLERYGLNGFPLMLTLAVLVRRWRLEWPALAVCGAGLLALNTLAAVGAYVP